MPPPSPSPPPQISISATCCQSREPIFCKVRAAPMQMTRERLQKHHYPRAFGLWAGSTGTFSMRRWNTHNVIFYRRERAAAPKMKLSGARVSNKQLQQPFCWWYFYGRSLYSCCRRVYSLHCWHIMCTSVALLGGCTQAFLLTLARMALRVAKLTRKFAKATCYNRWAAFAKLKFQCQPAKVPCS